MTFRTTSLLLELLVQFGHMTNPGPSSSGTNYFCLFATIRMTSDDSFCQDSDTKMGRGVRFCFPNHPFWFHIITDWQFDKKIWILSWCVVIGYSRIFLVLKISHETPKQHLSHTCTLLLSMLHIFYCKSNNLFTVIIQQTVIKFDAAAPLPYLFHEP